MDDIRILKGYAKYTSEFAIPTSAATTSVSETVNDLTALYLPFNSTTTNTSVSSSLTSVYLPFDSDVNDDSSNSLSVTAVGLSLISSAQSKFGG